MYQYVLLKRYHTTYHIKVTNKSNTVKHTQKQSLTKWSTVTWQLSSHEKQSTVTLLLYINNRTVKSYSTIVQTRKQSRVTLQLSRHANSQQLLYNCPDTQTVNSYSTIVQTRKQSTVTLQLFNHKKKQSTVTIKISRHKILTNGQQTLYNCTVIWLSNYN